MPLVINLDVHY